MITKSELSFENQVVSDIFLGFTNLYLNAEIYGLIKRQEYYIRSCYLDSLVTEFLKYWFDANDVLYYRAQLASDTDLDTLITKIHSFASERLDGLNWNMNVGTLQQGTFIPASGTSLIAYEITVGADNQTIFSGIPVNTNYYKLVNGYLNGTIISPFSSLTYVDGTLTYNHPTTTKAGDIIRLVFQYKF